MNGIDLNKVNKSEGFKVADKFFPSLDLSVSAACAASKSTSVHVLGWAPVEQNWVSVGLCDYGKLIV